MPEHTRDMIDAMIEDWANAGYVGNLIVKVGREVMLVLVGHDPKSTV